MAVPRTPGLHAGGLEAHRHVLLLAAAAGLFVALSLPASAQDVAPSAILPGPGAPAAAFQGLTAGIAQTGRSAWNLGRHPLHSVRGLSHGLDHWEEWQYAFAEESDHYRRSWSSDRSRAVHETARLVGILLATCLGSTLLVIVGQRVDRLPARVLARHRARVTPARLPHSVLGRLRGRARAIRRVREAELHRRAGRVATWPRALAHRFLDAGRDVAAVLSLAVRYPLELVLSLTTLLLEGIGRFGWRVARWSWEQTAYLLIPAALIFQTLIDEEIAWRPARTEAADEVRAAAVGLLDDVGSANLRELAERLDRVAEGFAAHRQLLIAPLDEIERRQDAEFTSLTAVAEAIDSAALRARLSLSFKRYGRRSSFLMMDAFDWHAEEPHGPLTPSRNRLVSHSDEIALLERARGLAGSPEAAALVEDRIEESLLRQAYEWCWRVGSGVLEGGSVPESFEGCGSPGDPAPVVLERLRLRQRLGAFFP